MKQRLGIAQALLCEPKLLICDEPTSALDPLGRKEILDVLLAASEQTTVLFSTHILSDVERICTDVAFLDNGVVNIQGKLSEIKSKYRKEEYILQTEDIVCAKLVCDSFSSTVLLSDNRVIFREDDGLTVHALLRFLSDKHLPVIKLEKAEPNLESLFMEVVEK
jgi:ABC-2 type transport system ATP-binding protein